MARAIAVDEGVDRQPAAQRRQERHVARAPGIRTPGGTGRVIDNVRKVIVGKDDEVRLTMLAMLCEGHLLIEDVPGVGKTMLARALALSIGCTFRRIQFTPDMLPTDVTGVSIERLQGRRRSGDRAWGRRARQEQEVKTPIESIVLVLIGSFIGSFGAVFLKAGAAKLNRGLKYLVLNARLALGVFFFLGSSYFFVLGVRRGELSVLYPLVSLGYLWTLLWSRIFFKEPITRDKFYGLALILLGIVFVGLGNR
jgi:multidrug transporter EmrE-like cation transporter